MIGSSLPPSPSKQTRQSQSSRTKPASEAQLAWQKSKSDSSKSTLPTTNRAPGKQPQRGNQDNLPLPSESFVLLQDSVLQTIPAPSTPSPRTTSRTKSQNALSADNEKGTTFEPDQNPSPLSHHLRSTARLFNILSSRTDIDHPLCGECTRILLGSLQRQLDETRKERDGYIAFEKEIKKEKEKESQGPPKHEMEKKIEKLKNEEKLAIQQLKDAEREREQLEEELRNLEADEHALEVEEEEQVNRFVIELTG
jgi:beclin